MQKSSALRIGAVVLAVGLTGSYVWFRAAQAQQPNDRVMADSKSGRVRVEQPAFATTMPASEPTQLLLPGSKAMVLTGPAERPDAVQTSLPSTAPTTTKRAVFYGSKSAPVDLTPATEARQREEAPAVRELPATQPSTAPETQTSTAPSSSARNGQP